MNELQIFKNDDFGEIRTVTKNGNTLFCGSDIAKALGYVVPTKAVNTHCKGVSKMEVPTNGGKQQMLFVSEGDMYRLIVNSKLPSAERFEMWVFDDVLPSIRKHGLYAKDELLANPDLFISALEELKTERQARIQAEKEVEYKTEVINGVVDDIDILTKRNVLNRVVRHRGSDFRTRWTELYRVFRETYSIDLKARCEGYNLKQERKKDKLSTVKYAEKFGHLDNLYKVAVKLYESDISDILEELKGGRANAN